MAHFLVPGLQQFSGSGWPSATRVDVDYYISPIWVNALRNSDAVLASFFRYYYEARNVCALYVPRD